MDSKKKQNPAQASREANTQQLTELKYLKAQIATKDARIKELEAKLKAIDETVGIPTALKA